MSHRPIKIGMMNKAERLEFRKRLQQNLLESTSNADRVRESAKPVELDQNRVGRLSRMDAMQAQAMAQANSQRGQQQIHLIKQALLRLEHGEFGDCLECGDAIEAARLKFDPATECCIRCAERNEKR